MRTLFSCINEQTLLQAPLKTHPYPYLVINNLIYPDKLAQICAAFPSISQGGSFPVSQIAHQGRALKELIEDLESDRLRHILENKFAIKLLDRPTMTTLRGISREKDGRVHTDSKDKLLTLLIYLNDNTWVDAGGQLRVLNSENLDDYVEEIPPTAGSCIIFKVTPNCWHGYTPYIGVRRSLQFNYLASTAAHKRHEGGHRRSARFKAFVRWLTRRNKSTMA